MFSEILSKILTFFMSIILLLSGGKNDRVQLKIVNTVTSAESRIEYEMTNKTGFEVTTGESFTLEKYVDGEWTTDWPGIEGHSIMFNEMACIILPYGTHKDAFNLGRFGVFLDEGQYRFSKEYHSVYGVGTVSAVFTVSE